MIPIICAEPEDWAVLMRVLDTIKSAIPAGSNAPPVEILNVIETHCGRISRDRSSLNLIPTLQA